MRVAAAALRRISSTILVALLVVVVSAAPLSRPAYAGWTPNKCDGGAKYWCFAEYYVPISGGVQVQSRYFAGARDDGWDWWNRHTIQDWRFDYSFYYYLGGWGASAAHYNFAPWEYESVTSWRDVTDEAIVRSQFSGVINVDPHSFWCETYVDWHMYNSGHYWQLGTLDCL